MYFIAPSISHGADHSTQGTEVWVEQVVAALRGDGDFLEFFDEDVVLDIQPVRSHPLFDGAPGKEGVRQLLAWNAAYFKDPKVVVEFSVAVNDTVTLIRGREAWTLRGTRVDCPFIAEFHWNTEGKIVRWIEHWCQGQFLEALDLVRPTSQKRAAMVDPSSASS